MSLTNSEKYKTNILFLGLKYYFKRYVKNFANNIRFLRRKRKFDVVLVSSPKSQGWILDAICKEIAQHWPRGRVNIYYGKDKLPKARFYFLSHYSMIKTFMPNHPAWKNKVFAFYTHPRDLNMPDSELAFWLNRVTKVTFLSRAFHDFAREIGVKDYRIGTASGGADPEFFRYHERTQDGSVGFCSAFYDRKNPDLIFNLIKAMPHRKFLLLGKDWQQYAKFAELQAMPNFTYVETEYKNYPDYYDKMTVFISPSKLEGGPVPLIEAMMSNVVPVASNTGFVPDVISHGNNGFIFSTECNLDEITKFVDAAFALKTNIRETVQDYTWQKFSEKIYNLSKNHVA